ncbi:hypothetical protein ACOSQ4_029441 [Xanthoceras sorbifolium]
MHRFSSGLELANLVVSSGLLRLSWTAILKLYKEFNQNEQQIRFRVDQKSNCTVIVFVASNTITKHCLQEDRELVSSSSLPVFHYQCFKSNSGFSILKTAVTLFDSLLDQLSNLKTQLSNSTQPDALSRICCHSLYVMATRKYEATVHQKCSLHYFWCTPYR